MISRRRTTLKVTLESTDLCVELVIHGCRIPARIWEGVSDGGVRVHCYITRVAVAAAEQNMAQFEAELRQCRAPSVEVAAIPLRLIL